MSESNAGSSLDERVVVELARRLVAIPSHPGVERQEEAVALELAGWLAERGLEPELDEVAPGRPNLTCTVAGKEPGRHLVLCGHTDTVALNADDPGYGFSAEVRDGRLLGRGSVDMKGAVAAMAGALVTLAEGGALSAGRVTLAAVVDEEMEGRGVERLVAAGITADGAVVGEPTGNRPCLGHKGLEWLEIDFAGRAAHGGTPERGVNAIDAAARFVTLVEEELRPRFEQRRHPLLGCPTINFGVIRGGDQPSTVAARCRLALDRRSVPGETPESVLAELEELLARLRSERPGVETALAPYPGGAGELERHAFATDPDHPLARALAAAVAAEEGGSPDFGAFPAWTDGGMLARYAGIPTTILGPGDLALAHSPREALPIGELLAAARIYHRTAVGFCAR